MATMSEDFSKPFAEAKLQLETMKICYKCMISKPISAYRTRPRKPIENMCRECVLAYNRNRSKRYTVIVNNLVEAPIDNTGNQFSVSKAVGDQLDTNSQLIIGDYKCIVLFKIGMEIWVDVIKQEYIDLADEIADEAVRNLRR